MEPCCLKIIDCEEYDDQFEGYGPNGPVENVASGEHHFCPKDAVEAEQLIAGSSASKFSVSKSMILGAVLVVFRLMFK